MCSNAAVLDYLVKPLQIFFPQLRRTAHYSIRKGIKISTQGKLRQRVEDGKGKELENGKTLLLASHDWPHRGEKATATKKISLYN